MHSPARVSPPFFRHLGQDHDIVACGPIQRQGAPLIAALDPPAVWDIQPRIGATEQATLGADSLLLAQLLWNRGFHTASDAAAFLDPSSTPLSDPFLLAGLETAVATVEQALAARETIAIYGDYDVDGVAGAALLHTALQRLGANVRVHIPDRSRDGYGVHPQAIRDLAEAGARVLITVDCGISANEPIALATELGVRVIVTDHHIAPEMLPAAAAVINPNQPACRYPFKDLAGGGVAFHLARAFLKRALDRRAYGEAVLGLTPFAALSTVADIVPLQADNRTLVATGLAHLRKGAIPGIRALCAVAGQELQTTTARDLAFGLIPRLNAASRMGVARDALELLIAADDERAMVVAEKLETNNVARKDRMLELIEASGAEAAEQAASGAVVLDGAYPIGLAGLLASRLVDRFLVPAVVIERGEGTSRGSVRGTEGTHAVRALESCADLLMQFGGHERAAGFSMQTEQIVAFRQTFAATIRAQRGTSAPVRTFLADGVLHLESIGERLSDLLDRFEPVGAGNARPLFVSRRVQVQQADEVRGGHISVRVAQGQALVRGIAFNPRFTKPAPGALVDVLYEVDRRIWQGETRVELRIHDLRPAH